jgi:DUF1680 family protein
MADEAIALVEAAQRPDGYLNTFVQVLAPGSEYKDLQWGHELYCIGHLVQAAISWHRALGDDRLLLVAERACASIERELGPGGREGIDGHPEIEMALVELFRVSGERRWLDLATSFIDRRGRGWLGDARFRARLLAGPPPGPRGAGGGRPRRPPDVPDSGAVDVAVETGDDALLDAGPSPMAGHGRDQDVSHRGARQPPQGRGVRRPVRAAADRAYAETCAAIASTMLAWRLLLATGDPACADLIERSVYNAVLPSLSSAGTSFFYVNPLQRRTHRTWTAPGEGERAPWYACACCPPNLMRLVGSWHQMLATQTPGGGVLVQQYAPRSSGRATVRLAMTTDYPWDGTVRVEVIAAPDGERDLAFRVPGWCATASLRDGAGEELGRREGAAIVATRQWRPGDSLELRLDLAPRVTRPHPRVDAIRGCVAFERGPLVYAIESADLPAGVELEDVAIPDGATARDASRPDLGPSIVGLTTAATAAGTPIELAAIPYFAWANRGVGGMRVWIPEAGS